MVKKSPKKPIHSKILPKNYNEFATFCYIIFIISYGINFQVNKTPKKRRIIKTLLKKTTKMVRKRNKND
jgi:hypothetical protein